MPSTAPARRAALAAVLAAGCLVANGPARAQSYVVTRVYRPPVVVTQVYRPPPVVVYRPWAPPVVVHRPPVVVQRWYR